MKARCAYCLNDAPSAGANDNDLEANLAARRAASEQQRQLIEDYLAALEEFYAPRVRR